MKNSRSYVKLALLMLLGAMIGMSGNIAIAMFRGGIEDLTAELGGVLQDAGMILEIVLAVLAAAVVTAIYIYLRKLWRLEQEAEDEAADAYGEKFEQWSQTGITITDCATGTLLVLGCCTFPGWLSPYGKEGILLMLLGGLMLLGCGYMAVMEIRIYHLMQKRDPVKKGDPSSLNFNKKWLEGCDETEKLVIYQAGYKAFGFMQIALLVGIVLAIWGEVQFHTGRFPLVLVGVIWIIGTAYFGIWKLKGINGRTRTGE